MNLSARYEAALHELDLREDAAQRRAITALERVADELIANRRASALSGRLRRLLGAAPPRPVTGVYLWGGVGRGKTFMMDLFFASLPFDAKLRYHFHRLMNHVHGRLKTLQDARDPLATVADELARRARVLCFDEFFVADIADAMILGRLLEALFERGVTLVATSNTPPDDLYRGGLQRSRFLPAIELIRTNMEVVHVDGLTDYRLRLLETAELWHAPLDGVAETNLATWFERMAPATGSRDEKLEVLGREIRTRRRSDGLVWFDFADLCGGPRSQDDYIEIARWFQTIILSNVPVLDGYSENEARRFIALVDELYDRRVNLIVSAADSIGRIYTGQRLRHEFERTRSRLLEMQSVEYLAAEHLP